MKKLKPSERPFVESYAEQAGILKPRRKDDVPRLYYLCGAVTNDPYAKLKFDLAELYLKSRGNTVINPLKVNPVGTGWEDAMATCLAILNRMKDVYIALLHLSRFMDDKLTYFPSIMLIDPPDREIESPGKRLELAIAFDVLPTMQMSSAWSVMLNEAIAKYESEVHDGKTE